MAVSKEHKGYTSILDVQLKHSQLAPFLVAQRDGHAYPQSRSFHPMRHVGSCRGAREEKKRTGKKEVKNPGAP